MFQGVAATPALASESAPAAPATDEARKAHQALRELDRFLDHHPLLEEQLRLTPALLTKADYLQAHPEVQAFVAANPGVTPALAHEPRHLVLRALMLQAAEPLRWTEIAPLDPLLHEVTTLEHDLARHPERVHDEKFLQAHPRLRELLATHPPLARAFLAVNAPLAH